MNRRVWSSVVCFLSPYVRTGKSYIIACCIFRSAAWPGTSQHHTKYSTQLRDLERHWLEPDACLDEGDLKKKTQAIENTTKRHGLILEKTWLELVKLTISLDWMGWKNCGDMSIGLREYWKHNLEIWEKPETKSCPNLRRELKQL